VGFVMSRTTKFYRLFLIAALLAANLFVDGLLAYALINERAHIEREVAKTVENVALLLDQNITGAAGKIDLSLHEVADELERELRVRGSLDGIDVNEMLAERREWLDELAEFRVMDAEGILRFGPGILPTDRLSFADRPFFITHREQAKAGLLVSNPLMGKVANKGWLISFSRRYNTPDGRFAGVISASVPISYFSQLLSGLNVGPHGIALLRDADTGMIAHQPPSDAAYAQIGAKGYSQELAQIIASGVKTKTFHSRQTADGVERTSNYRRLSAVPFHLIAGMGTEDYLEQWWAEVDKAILFAIVFFVGSGFSMALLWRSFSLIEKARDHTEEARERLRFSNAELLRLTEVMAHHFQEPARRLVTFSQLLRKSLEGQPINETAETSLTFIEQQANRLRFLIRDIQLYLMANQPTDVIGPLDLKEIVERLFRAKALELAAIGAKVRIAPTLPMVLFDRRRMADMLDILLDNAIRYRRPSVPLEISVSAEVVGSMVRISFADNGCGILPEYRDRVFQIFERLHPEVTDESTGVGLSVVLRTVTDANGKVWIEETPGGGTTILIELPRGKVPARA